MGKQLHKGPKHRARAPTTTGQDSTHLVQTQAHPPQRLTDTSAQLQRADPHSLGWLQETGAGQAAGKSAHTLWVQHSHQGGPTCHICPASAASGPASHAGPGSTNRLTLVIECVHVGIILLSFLQVGTHHTTVGAVNLTMISTLDRWLKVQHCYTQQLEAAATHPMPAAVQPSGGAGMGCRHSHCRGSRGAAAEPSQRWPDMSTVSPHLVAQDVERLPVLYGQSRPLGDPPL